MENKELIDQIGAIICLVVILVVIIIAFIYELRKAQANRKAKQEIKKEFPQAYETYLIVKDNIENRTHYYVKNPQKEPDTNERD